MAVNHDFNRRMGFLLILLALMCCMPPAVEAQAPPGERHIVAIGSSRIYKGNTAGARKAAIDKGLEAALDIALVELVPAERLVGHFPAITRVMHKRTDDFLQGYKVLTEASTEDTYRAMVEAVISVDALKRHLRAAGIATSTKAMPKTLFFIAEKNLAHPWPSYWWGGDSVMQPNPSQVAMSSALESAGFPIVDPARPASGQPPALDHPPSIDLDTIIDIASRYGADVAIVGTSLAGLAANTMGAELRSYRGVVNIRAIRVDGGKELARVTQESISAASDDQTGGRQALDEAAALAAQELAGKVTAAWLVSDDMLTRVELSIEGTSDLANFVMFRRVIKKIPGVKSIQTKEMKPDQATLVVEYQGEVSALAQGMMLNTFERFRIDIYEVTGEQMRVALIPQ